MGVGEQASENGSEASGHGAFSALERRILTYVAQQVEETGAPVLLSGRMIAAALEEDLAAVARYLAKLTAGGHIVARSAGPRGRLLSVGSGEPPAKRRRRPPRRVEATKPATPSTPDARSRRAPAPAASLATSATAFCPWCGSRAAKEWRHCASCGEKLPRL